MTLPAECELRDDEFFLWLEGVGGLALFSIEVPLQSLNESWVGPLTVREIGWTE